MTSRVPSRARPQFNPGWDPTLISALQAIYTRLETIEGQGGRFPNNKALTVSDIPRNVNAATAAAAAGANPTKAEFDKLLADVNEMRTILNQFFANART